MPDEVLHNSEGWCVLLDVRVMDPDGWDRLNFKKSWAEMITKAEFLRRSSKSTCDFRGYKATDSTLGKIFKPKAK